MTHDDSHDELRDLLRQADRMADMPPIDPVREAALLRRFDAADRGERPAARSASMRWLAAAAILVVAAGAAVVWMLTSRSPVVAPQPPPIAASDITDFVPWPGAAALPRFESGQLVRMDLPASMLPSLGLFPSTSRVGFVRADVLFGQDGLARAVRLLPPSPANEGSP